MKKFIKQPSKVKAATAVKANSNWPAAEDWVAIDVRSDAYYDMMMDYLNEAECDVNDEFDVSLEPSGNIMFIVDNSCQNDDIEMNYEEWCENERQMAEDSKSVDEFKKKYRTYLSGILS